MKPNEPQDEAWQVLKPGSLVQFAARENGKETRRQMIRVAGASAVVVLAGILFSLRGTDSMEPNYGGIRCSAVQSKAKDHLAGRLDAVTEAKIVQHLAECPVCASFMKRAANVSSLAVPHVHYVAMQSQQE